MAGRLLEKIQPRLLKALYGGDDDVEVCHFGKRISGGGVRTIGFKETKNYIFRLIPERGDSFLGLGKVFIRHAGKSSFFKMIGGRAIAGGWGVVNSHRES